MIPILANMLARSRGVLTCSGLPGDGVQAETFRERWDVLGKLNDNKLILRYSFDKNWIILVTDLVLVQRRTHAVGRIQCPQNHKLFYSEENASMMILSEPRIKLFLCFMTVMHPTRSLSESRLVFEYSYGFYLIYFIFIYLFYIIRVMCSYYRVFPNTGRHHRNTFSPTCSGLESTNSVAEREIEQWKRRFHVYGKHKYLLFIS